MAIISRHNAARDCQLVRSAVMTSRGIMKEVGKVYLAYISVLSVAMELIANTIQVCSDPTVIGVLALSRSDTRTSSGLGDLALTLGDGWVGKLTVNCLDSPLNPIGSALGALSAWNEGVSLLGCVPEEGLHSVPGKACVSAAVSLAALP